MVLLPGLTLAAADLSSLCADRAALERVYYSHRLGEKPPFEKTLPQAVLQELVRLDLLKEATLKQTYGIEITPALLDAEVQRINTTTRAPEMLAEIKAALGNDPTRFANVFARPLIVERQLRTHFDNDDALHAPQRRMAEGLRTNLLAARRGAASLESLVAILKDSKSGTVNEATWQLTPRPPASKTVDEVVMKQHFGPNAQLLRPAQEHERKFYFEDLNPELQNVLRVQLQGPGDVSAVIETPSGFLLCVAREKCRTELSAAVLSVPKQNYDAWLQRQSDRGNQVPKGQ